MSDKEVRRKATGTRNNQCFDLAVTGKDERRDKKATGTHNNLSFVLAVAGKD